MSTHDICFWEEIRKNEYLGSVIQSIVSLTKVKILTVLVSTIFNSQIFLLVKCV